MRILVYPILSFFFICLISGTTLYTLDKRDAVGQKWDELREKMDSLSPREQDKLLRHVSTQLEELAPELKNSTEARLRDQARMPSERIRERIEQLDHDISAFQTVETLARLKALMRGDEQALLAAFRGDLEQQLRIQEKTYLEEILPTVRANEQAVAVHLEGRRALEKARLEERQARNAVILARCKLRGVSGPCRLTTDHGISRSADDPAVEAVAVATDRLRDATRQRAQAEKILASRTSRLVPVRAADLVTPSAEEALQDIEAAATREAESWFNRVSRDGPGWAVKILGGIAAVWFLIRFVLFFLVAPRVERAAPRALAPDLRPIDGPADRGIDRSPKGASREIEVRVGSGEELLVRPGRAMLEPGDARVGKAWFLDNENWFRCWRNGLTGFERIRSDDGSVAVGSDAMLVEICELTVPAGSGLVVLPKHLVGLVRQHRGPQPRLRVRWLLSSAFAWVTGHFHFVIIEGPARILLEGGGGLRIESADGRLGSYLDWIAFDAAMPVRVRRPNSFWTYLWKWRGLVRVRAEAGNGFALRQLCSVREARRKGAEERIQGMIDAVTKPLGV